MFSPRQIIASVAVGFVLALGGATAASAAPATAATTAVNVSTAAAPTAAPNWRYTTKKWSEYRNLYSAGNGRCVMNRVDITATYFFLQEVSRKELIQPAFTGQCSNKWWRF